MAARNVHQSRSLLERFRDEKYVSWLKVGQALLVTAEALYAYCQNPLMRYHEGLRTRLPKPTCTVSCGDTPCGSCATWRQSWRDDIASHLTPRHDGRLPIWKNADKTKWENDYWEVAKVFMLGPIDTSCSGPDDTDSIGLLQLIINCDLFDEVITPDRLSVKEVRTIRNKLFHSPKYHISKNEMKVHIQNMIKFLEDPVYLIRNTAAQSAVDTLNEILIFDIDESTKAVERRLWKIKIDCLLVLQLKKEQVEDLVKFVRRHEDLMSCVGNDIGKLKGQMEKIDVRTGKLEREVKSIKRRLPPEHRTQSIKGGSPWFQNTFLVLTVGVLLFAAIMAWFLSEKGGSHWFQDNFVVLTVGVLLFAAIMAFFIPDKESTNVRRTRRKRRRRHGSTERIQMQQSRGSTNVRRTKKSRERKRTRNSTI